MQIEFSPNQSGEAIFEDDIHTGLAYYLPESELVLRLTDDDFEKLRDAVYRGTDLMIHYSAWSVSRLRNLLKVMASALIHFEELGLTKEGQFQEDSVLRTDSRGRLTFQRNFEEAMSDFVYGLTGMPVSAREYLELMKTKIDFDSVDEHCFGDWDITTLELKTLTQEEREALKSNEMSISNASVLAGMVKPIYFNDGIIQLAIGPKTIVIDIKGKDADLLLDTCFEGDEKKLIQAASEAWDAVTLFTKGVNLFRERLTMTGLSESSGYFRLSQFSLDVLNRELNAIKEASLNPKAMKSYIETHQLSKEDNKE